MGKYLFLTDRLITNIYRKYFQNIHYMKGIGVKFVQLQSMSV